VRGQNEMIELLLAAPVRCTDQPCGSVTSVVVEPYARRVTHLIVEPGHQHAFARLVPMGWITAINEDILLRGTLAQWRSLPYVEEVEVVPTTLGMWNEFGLAEIPMTVEHLPAGEVVVKRGDHVNATDGRVGRVEGLVVDADGHVRRVLLQEGHLWGRRVVAIPVAAIERIDVEGLHVGRSKRELAHLPVRE
jgi:uncharacterized protein YrrD